MEIGTIVIFMKIRFNNKIVIIDPTIAPFLPNSTTIIEETERDIENNKLTITMTSSCHSCHKPIKTKFILNVPVDKLPCTDLLEQHDTIAICTHCYNNWQDESIIVKIRESWS